MARIQAAAVINAPVDRVWDIVSDLDNEPRFWKGTKRVRNVSELDGRIVREITIAFRDKRCMQEVELEPKSRIRAVFTEGIIDGTKTLTLEPDGRGTRLEVVWEVRLSGAMGVFTGMIKNHIRSGTESAVSEIKREAEG